MHITVHINPTQKHHYEHYCWWRDGLKKHGIELRVTNDICTKADVHIITGPHYGYQFWKGQNEKVIWLDRALWHEDKSGKWNSMDYVSLGWLRSDGGRVFANSKNNADAPCITANNGKGSIYLAEHNEVIRSRYNGVRLHPLNKQYGQSFEEHVGSYAKAIGGNTTALVKAGLMGLAIECFDKRNVMSEPDWIDILPYTDWRYDEIERGEAWEHLQAVI